MFEPFEVTISQIRDLTHDVKEYDFDLGGMKLDYLPGQYVQIIAPIEKEDCDQRCNIRSYSIASASTETQKYNKILIATKFAKDNPSVFKKHLIWAKVGEKYQIRGPMGRFLLQEDLSKEAVMLSGGIGITPFRNMIKFATDKNLPLKITLFYSNKTREDIVFKNDFDEMANVNKNLKIIHAITDENNLENWNGEKGYINEGMVRKYITNVNNATFYICGPGAMVDALKSTLQTMNIAEDHIHHELFSGY